MYLDVYNKASFVMTLTINTFTQHTDIGYDRRVYTNKFFYYHTYDNYSATSLVAINISKWLFVYTFGYIVNVLILIYL